MKNYGPGQRVSLGWKWEGSYIKGNEIFQHPPISVWKTENVCVALPGLAQTSHQHKGDLQQVQDGQRDAPRGSPLQASHPLYACMRETKLMVPRPHELSFHCQGCQCSLGRGWGLSFAFWPSQLESENCFQHSNVPCLQAGDFITYLFMSTGVASG